MSFLKIIPVDSKNLKELQKISVTTFKETFVYQNTKENIESYLKINLSMKQIKKEFDNPFSEFYFAFNNKVIVGYLKLNFKSAQSENVLKNKAYEIERIYILKSQQRKGFGRQLFEKAVDIGKSKGYKKLWLGVWENNKAAINFYKKLNLSKFDEHIFLLGKDIQTDFLMKYNF